MQDALVNVYRETAIVRMRVTVTEVNTFPATNKAPSNSPKQRDIAPCRTSEPIRGLVRAQRR